ncbi:xanthine phosphoribosyltransferase [Terribacillus saccharophilus]|uniref:Xanthine phosphoribosyltransferase n=1 Tax=Terribacillus saccharophilus TaxID=361277 RepID=A0A075LGR6_9BACI|nr:MULTISPECIES: xanthine phosphoribosyltransferase [Terribacillus]AIF65491.1 xanthine phosphoribosyltransferase [Terribacillus goriensis]MCM3227647.1 xanthine phosphoribosyltransferase [Terribacillus saccharophilus]MEC0284088.1 xanthine phosphoribosyltransferase [Terribacillus saccharophilus]MEC0289634.1 xanthine phosphoribosyltransferase [Terribacillus saccharophilus]MEC0302365.1 xanthine phosphoribosyltransferase [Terribacillus saccharophilus]
MELLQKAIQERGTIIGETIVKVDSFLNHEMDTALLYEIGQEFRRQFQHKPVTKIVTIEAGGIAPALMAGLAFNVPVVYAKKQKSLTMKGDVYVESVYSFTKQVHSDVTISKDRLSPEDHVLIIDDFLANGEAAAGLISILNQAGATVAGIGIVIEKSFQRGRSRLEELGIEVVSLARIARIGEGKIEFLNS